MTEIPLIEGSKTEDLSARLLQIEGELVQSMDNGDPHRHDLLVEATKIRNALNFRERAKHAAPLVR